MVRIFGLIVALAALMSPASAALLGKYEFTGNSLVASPDPAFTAIGGTFSSFNSTGTLTGSGANDRYQFTAPATASAALNASSSNPYVGFSVSGTSASYTISKLTFTLQQLGPVGNEDADGGNMRAYYRLAGGSWLTYGNLAGYSLSTTSTLVSTLNVVVPASTTVEFAFRVRNETGFDQTLYVDNVMLEGVLVPEPASMAIFGSLAAFGLVRRFRRK